MTELIISYAADQTYPVDADSEASSIERGWAPAWYVHAETRRDESNPDDAVYFRLAEGTGRHPMRHQDEGPFDSQDEALDAALRYEGVADIVTISEMAAYDREMIAAERAFEARYG